jgi:hypothetical protein
MLQERGITATGKAEDKKNAENNGILNKIEEQIIEEGWESKLKGMLQILWERGWIDEGRLQDYTVNGQKDALGTTINDTLLRYLLGNCEDFINKKSMLQYYGRMMGVLVDRTPKCHCELAGEGIEYSWAAAKNKYRRVPIGIKKPKNSFGNWLEIVYQESILQKSLSVPFCDVHDNTSVHIRHGISSQAATAMK